jgi:hypothetical protein
VIFDLDKSVTHSRVSGLVSMLLCFVLGFGVAVMLTGHDRWDIIGGAVVLGATFWVGLQ